MVHAVDADAARFWKRWDFLPSKDDPLVLFRSIAEIAASLAEPRNNAAIAAKVEAVKSADLRLANARADAFAKLQASPGRLSRDQATVLAATGGGRAAFRGNMGGIPSMTSQQVAALTRMAGFAE